MNWSDFRGKTVALLGGGMENLALIPHLLKAGAVVSVCDQSAIKLPRQYRNIQKLVGPNYLNNLGEFAVIFRSPGLPVKQVREALKGQRNKPHQTSATDLFLSMYRDRVVGVTGTKGKGTTATMLGSILSAEGRPHFVAGNIGRPIFEVLDMITPQTVVVLELSSFQLEDIQHSPHGAVILPVTADHLEPLSPRSPNYHPTLGAYVQAKAGITRFQQRGDWVVFAANNHAASTIAQQSVGEHLRVSDQLDAFAQLENGVVSLTGEKLELSKLGLHGSHIFLDAALAAAAAVKLGVDSEAIRRGLSKFKPLPHRLQTVAVKGGITFVDDSYATAPDAAAAAISAFTEPIVWIGGGSSKGADFTELVRTIADSSVKAVVLIGQEAARLSEAIREGRKQLPIKVGAASMGQAVQEALSMAKAGEVVLLSPACASKDMFRDADERGDLFQGTVNELKL